MAIVKNTIPANSTAEINVSGNFVYLIDCNVDLSISLDDETPEFLSKATGYKSKDGKFFRRISLINDTATIASFNLQVGIIKDLIDNRSVINGVVPIKNASNDFATGRLIAIGTSAAIIRAATPTQTKVEIQNEGTSTLFIGRDNTVTTSTGYPVPAGTAKTIEGSQAVWGIRAALTENAAFLSELVV